ncbi:MAG: nitrite reductase/ring-hydroxylating ferredoxin subunit [Arenicella sp.]|jgi:nitrite reductase/ring-hydroxylating ferredoxin subunit
MFDNRSTKIDYQRIDTLLFVGCYQRRLPVSITRMIENAYDWEHLPHVHESSFQAIELVNEGDWGWQAITTQPDSRRQYIELLLDKDQCYWATTILSGGAKGFEIHTQATQVANREIDIRVNFYLPKPFSKVLTFLNIGQRFLPFALYKQVASKLGVARLKRGDTAQASILKTLQSQYSVLYDEDELLMIGRQEAIDRRKSAKIVGPSKLKALSSPEVLDSAEVLPNCAEALPNDAEALPNDAEALPHCAEALPHCAEALCLGTEDELKQQLPKLVEFGKSRYVLNRWQHQWVIYAADCPHLLGPLQDAIIDQAGIITCPWHGYRFNVLTGQNCSSDKANLQRPPIVSLDGNELMLKEPLIKYKRSL